MELIVDTCIWIGIAQGQFSQRSLIASAGDAAVYISAISLGELEFGVHSSIDPVDRAAKAAFLRSLETKPVLEISSATAAAFGLLAAAMKQSGRSPRPRFNDLWMAAQAIENGFGLMTVNVRDFEGLPGLKVVAV